MRCKGLALFQNWLHEFPCHASRQVPGRSYVLHHPPSVLLSLTYSPIQVDITDPQLTMGEQVSFTRFLCCACHARGEGSAFFGTRRAAELHISRSAGCKNACKGVQSVPVLYRDSQRQEDHWPARPVSIASAKGASSYPIYAYDTRYRYAWFSHRYMKASYRYIPM